MSKNQKTLRPEVYKFADGRTYTGQWQSVAYVQGSGFAWIRALGLRGLGFRGLGFIGRGLGFRDLGFRGLGFRGFGV